MVDYDDWRTERFTELDTIHDRIAEFPPLIRSLVARHADTLVTLINGVNGGGHLLGTGKYVENATRQIAAELDRISVAAVSDA